MDTDISKMFKEKNKEIFINSLSLEMERNLETLKNTTDNCVALEINKLFLFLKNYFQENDIDFKKEELLGVLYRERKELNDIINNNIEIKKNKIKKEFLDKDIKEDTIDEEYITKYYEKLIKETEKINEEIEIQVKTEICTVFSPKLIKKYKLESVDQLDRIHSRVDSLFKENILSKVKEQTRFRDESLRNMSQESYNKYLDLNRSTTENS